MKKKGKCEKKVRGEKWYVFLKWWGRKMVGSWKERLIGLNGNNDEEQSIKLKKQILTI